MAVEEYFKTPWVERRCDECNDYRVASERLGIRQAWDDLPSRWQWMPKGSERLTTKMRFMVMKACALAYEDWRRSDKHLNPSPSTSISDQATTELYWARQAGE